MSVKRLWKSVLKMFAKANKISNINIHNLEVVDNEGKAVLNSLSPEQLTSGNYCLKVTANQPILAIHVPLDLLGLTVTPRPVLSTQVNSPLLGFDRKHELVKSYQKEVIHTALSMITDMKKGDFNFPTINTHQNPFDKFNAFVDAKKAINSKWLSSYRYGALQAQCDTALKVIVGQSPDGDLMQLYMTLEECKSFWRYSKDSLIKVQEKLLNYLKGEVSTYKNRLDLMNAIHDLMNGAEKIPRKAVRQKLQKELMGLQKRCREVLTAALAEPDTVRAALHLSLFDEITIENADQLKVLFSENIDGVSFDTFLSNITTMTRNFFSRNDAISDTNAIGVTQYLPVLQKLFETAAGSICSTANEKIKKIQEKTVQENTNNLVRSESEASELSNASVSEAGSSTSNEPQSQEESNFLVFRNRVEALNQKLKSPRDNSHKTTAEILQEVSFISADKISLISVRQKTPNFLKLARDILVVKFIFLLKALENRWLRIFCQKTPVFCGF